MDTRELFKCGILNDLCNGKEPKKTDYVGEGALTDEEYSKIIDEMIAEGLVTGVVSAMERSVIRGITWWDKAKITPKGKRYLEDYMNRM